MRSLSPVEIALCVAVGGSVLAVGVPAFVRDLHASRLVEPIEGLNHIAAAAMARAESEPAPTPYPDSVARTPSIVAVGKPVRDPPGTWDHPTWRSLGLEFSRPHSYSFAFDNEGRGRRHQYKATAWGDLDGDGQLSEFSIRGEVTEGREPVTFPMEMHREVE
jgi:hypothetical protein